MEEKLSLKNLHILVLEDDPEDFEEIELILENAGLSFKAERVNKKEEFIQALKENKADVILSDHFLPQFNSSEALKLYREFGVQIPFILVTGAVSEEFAVTSIKNGADDYILKSHMTRLPSAIINAIKKREAEAANMRAIIRFARNTKNSPKSIGSWIILFTMCPIIYGRRSCPCSVL